MKYIKLIFEIMSFRIYNFQNRRNGIMFLGYIVKKNNYHNNIYDINYLINYFVQHEYAVVLVDFRSIWSMFFRHDVFVGFGRSYNLSRASRKILFHTEGPQMICQNIWDSKFTEKPRNNLYLNRCGRIFRHIDEINAKEIIILGNDLNRWDHCKGIVRIYWPRVQPFILSHDIAKNRYLFYSSHGSIFKGLLTINKLAERGFEIDAVGIFENEFIGVELNGNINNKGFINLQKHINYISSVRLAFSYSVSEGCPTGLYQLWLSGIPIIISSNCGIVTGSLEGIYVVDNEDEFIRTFIQFHEGTILPLNKAKMKEDIQRVMNMNLDILK
jgi:hypothetical protein